MSTIQNLLDFLNKNDSLTLLEEKIQLFLFNQEDWKEITVSVPWEQTFSLKIDNHSLQVSFFEYLVIKKETSIIETIIKQQKDNPKKLLDIINPTSIWFKAFLTGMESNCDILLKHKIFPNTNIIIKSAIYKKDSLFWQRQIPFIPIFYTTPTPKLMEELLCNACAAHSIPALKFLSLFPTFSLNPSLVEKMTMAIINHIFNYEKEYYASFSTSYLRKTTPLREYVQFLKEKEQFNETLFKFILIQIDKHLTKFSHKNHKDSYLFFNMKDKLLKEVEFICEEIGFNNIQESEVIHKLLKMCFHKKKLLLKKLVHSSFYIANYTSFDNFKNLELCKKHKEDLFCWISKNWVMPKWKNLSTDEKLMTLKSLWHLFYFNKNDGTKILAEYWSKQNKTGLYNGNDLINALFLKPEQETVEKIVLSFENYQRNKLKKKLL